MCYVQYLFDLTIDINDPVEPNASFVSVTSLVLICLLLKYESLPHKDTINLV